MEQIPTVEIEGLEEAVASLTALSEAIGHLGQSAKETLQAFAASLSPPRQRLIQGTAAGSAAELPPHSRPCLRISPLLSPRCLSLS
jgi:hypothetical protein